MSACIVGWAHTPFGKLEGEDIESLITRVTREAIADAGISPGDIDEIYLGHFGEGFVRERFLSSLPLQVAEAMRFTPPPGLKTPVPRDPQRCTKASTASLRTRGGSCWSSALKK